MSENVRESEECVSVCERERERERDRVRQNETVSVIVQLIKVREGVQRPIH